MSIRNLFDGTAPTEIFAETTETIREDGESLQNIKETWENRKRFIPQVDFANPESFARYGSAEKYYEDAITRIYEDYPYDGSSREKQEFLNESTYMDLWLLDNKYPRTNGFITISAEGWGTRSGAPESGYGNPDDKEYISFVGGPHTASEGMIGKKLSSTFDDSNKYDTDIYGDKGFSGTGTRESNLKTNFDNGVTVEFWLKKDSFDANKTEKEVIFDLWNGESPSDSTYGRVLVQLTGTLNNNFLLTVQSGASAAYTEELFGSSTTPTTLQSFGHYAFRMYNSGSDLNVDFYKNGRLLESKASSPSLGEVTGALNANIGSLTSPVRLGGFDYGNLGWGKLSGSLDEFRFWKTKRSSKQIGRYWFTQVNGGTNQDAANAGLGVYFKFNEGITGISSIDSVVLDYSGRITNGTWTGYNTSARSTSSAMVLAGASAIEFKDPIIYSESPLVQSVLAEMKASGSYHDYNNPASLYNNFPTWIIDGDQNQSGYLKQLTQIMSSYFDALHLQVEQVNTLKNVSYVDSENKEIPFANELVANSGLVTKDMFTDANVLNQIFTRDENKNFEDDIFDVKNLIYKNVYNNIIDIYKSKGTEKSFRNLIRCYGVDEDLVRVNAYANNLVYDLSEEYRFSTAKKRLIDFYREDSFYASIYQQTASGNPNSVSFISASQGSLEDYTSFTAEAEFVLPKKRFINQSNYFATPFNTASVFGFHTADPATPTDLTWASTDYDVQVYAVRPDGNSNQTDGYFLLTSSYYGISEQTSLVKDLYDNKKWNLALRVQPTKVQSDLVSGSSTTNYSLELYAVNSILDTVQEELTLTAEITSDGDKLLNQPKRIYAGAHRQNFTGSSIHASDIRLGNVRYWATYLDDNVIKSHGRNAENFGSSHPYRNSYNFATSLTGTEIPQMETLAMHWRFDQITGSDNGSGVPTLADAGFNVLDYSSGSAEITQRYSWMGNVVGKQHTGRADFLYPSDTGIVNVDFIPIGKQTVPEIVNAYDTVKVFNIADEQLFTRQSRPTNFYYMVEKSMYASITQEIVNYFASILDFNNLIGDPVNRYRQEYKAMNKLRSLFFENVENTPDIERYIEYYKWIDDSLGQMLMDLFPASAIKQDGIRTTVESHALERNKYWNKYPTVDVKQEDPEAGIRGINALDYNWKDGHHPVNGSQDESCFWWKHRAERDEAPLASGIPGLDTARQQILSVTLSTLSRKYTTPLKYTVKKSEIVTSGVAIENNKREIVKKSVKFGDSNGILAKTSDIKDFPSCNDDADLNLKRKFAFKAENQLDSDPYLDGKGDLLLPFVAVSSSVESGYQSLVNSGLKDGFGIENLHVDSYIDSDVPMQGPFTEKFVGGNQHRHVDLNDGTDNALNRPEAWSIEFQGAPKAIKFVHQPVNHPRAMLYRDVVAKRSVNIKNIKTDTATYGVGNYSKDYEIVQTVSRTQNNVAFVKAGGFSVTEIPSPYVAGMDDYAKPQRGRTEFVFVNRFSSPGAPDTAGDSNGGPALDPEAAEFSPYNNLNYRNTTVRDPYNLLLASHVNQFGYYSDVFGIGAGPSTVNSLNYAGTASIYQVNRNPIKQMKDSGATTVTASVYDNFFVQHPIPRTDLQYAWVTSSYVSYDTFGYLPYDGDGDLIAFTTASDFVSLIHTPLSSEFRRFGKQKGDPVPLGDELVPTTFNWLSYNSKDVVDYTQSFIGYLPDDVDVESYLNETLIYNGVAGKGKSSLLNSILLRRNGPYQHPTWKQTRGYENPLARKWNSSNLTAYNLENDTFKLMQDPPVISKYKALRQILKVAVPKKSNGLPYTAVEDVFINSTFGNEATLFANRQINRDLNLSNANIKLAYDDIRTLYVDDAIDIVSNPIQGLGYLSYKEQVYPSAINMYTKRNRERINYKNTFWKNSREERSVLGKEKFGGTNSQGYVVSQSAWALDATEQFGTALSTYIALSASDGSPGELQNNYTIAFDLVGGAPGTPTAGDLKPGPIYARKQTMGSIFSTVSPTGPEALRQAVNSATFLMADELNAAPWPGTTTFNDLGHVSIFGGNAKFEAHEQAGFVEEGVFVSSPSNPFYDKYDQYVQNMRLKNKDMSLIPEFRISEHVEKYVEDTNGFLAANTGSFSIFGVNQENSETATYLDTDGNPASYDIQVSENTPQNSGQEEFYRIYSFSDFMESFSIISDDHDNFEIEKSLTLSCKALKKFIAYDGFYPSERTLDIANKFSDGYKDFITGSTYAKVIPGTTIDTSSYDMENIKMRPIMQPLFSPGILYNTIKAGVAVDHPIFTEGYDTTRYFDNGGNTALTSPVSNTDYSDYYAIGSFDTSDGKIPNRIPFEALMSPGKHLNTYRIYDSEPHPSASLSIYSAINGTSEDKDYSLMIENFLGEIPKFFLRNSELTSLKSADQSSDFIFEENKYYGMRVKMRKSLNKNPNPAGSILQLPQVYVRSYGLTPAAIDPNEREIHETITMYSRPSAFGPPLASGLSFDSSYMVPSAVPVSNQTIAADSLSGYYTSYTPPYYDGESWADIMFTPTESRSYDLAEIIAQSSVRYWRIDVANFPFLWPGADAPTPTEFSMNVANVNDNAMQLSASLNLFNLEFVEGNDNTKKTPRWVIQSKFETPILNFGDQTKSPYNFSNITTPATTSDPWLGYGGKTTTPVGMWHQFGLIPEKDQGVFLEVSEISPSWLENRAWQADTTTFYNAGDVEDLSAAVGFGTQVEKMGSLAGSKTVFEAVVAIPFVDVQDISKTKSLTVKPNQTARNFFELPLSTNYQNALIGINTPGDDTEIESLFPTGTDQSIIEMAEKIKDRYVFPPQFDFFRNENARPIAMYIFDFEHTFDKRDLSYMWQNIAPKIGNQFEEAEATIKHPLLTENNLLEDLKDRVKWMVFKVKQRAETRYLNNIVGSSDNAAPLFSYNWPYDYFSLIEFAKIDSSIEYGTIEEATVKTRGPNTTTGLPPRIDTDISIGNTTTTKQSRDAQSAVDANLQANIKTLEREGK